MKESQRENENENSVVKEKLQYLIESDEHTKSLTVAQMALRDLENGNINSAVSRLRVDLDKLVVTNRELYDYVLELHSKRHS